MAFLNDLVNGVSKVATGVGDFIGLDGSFGGFDTGNNASYSLAGLGDSLTGLVSDTDAGSAVANTASGANKINGLANPFGPQSVNDSAFMSAVNNMTPATQTLGTGTAPIPDFSLANYLPSEQTLAGLESGVKVAQPLYNMYSGYQNLKQQEELADLYKKQIADGNAGISGGLASSALA